jgi:hypothetical protein
MVPEPPGDHLRRVCTTSMPKPGVVHSRVVPAGKGRAPRAQPTRENRTAAAARAALPDTRSFIYTLER